MSDSDVERAGQAIRDGDLVVYPTETVYGLGAAALDADAVERVFEAKGRSRDKPVSLGVPTVEDALDHVHASDHEERFMREFLPGPVTVLCERRDHVPDVLTAGRDRVGIRVPDHDLALDLYRAAGTPVTATSANVSGSPSVTDPADLDPTFLEQVAVTLDGGVTAGTESTVVNVEAGEIHRPGALGDRIEAWLAEHD
ncbi:L-threonylcarbamoyladenylate synthase [Haloarchaeobius amylolyticus]|uniref:L-threonylcarbamoyladenylate synthase n=1 Tax=Haloarchaeobius amylolyticus TaxID=1198296 RepID=UPI0022718EEB|nr:L-threonylcarbamoyladenylate synthase [Haloarchaeobius amylolyticus]